MLFILPAITFTLAQTTVLKAGTEVIVKPIDTYNSSSVSPDQVMLFKTVEDVIIDDFIAISKGSHARARVIDVKKPRPYGRPGQFSFHIIDVIAKDDSVVPLTSELIQKKGKKIPLGIFFYYAMGNDAYLHLEDTIKVSVSRNVTIAIQ